MTNIWINLQTRSWNVDMLVNLLVIRFIRDIWCHDLMITMITIRIFIHMLIWFWVRQINIITNWIMMTQTCDIMFNWDFFLNSTNMWLRNNGNIRNYIVLNWRYMFLSMLCCAGEWLKCPLPFLDSCTFRCFIECLQFESLSALLGGHKSGHS